MSGGGGARGLSVKLDGQPMPEDEARAFWQRFSDYMEEHKGDLAGFAKQEGLASVHPGIDGGRPVLIASKTAPQGPYVRADRGPLGGTKGGGSSGHQKSKSGGGHAHGPPRNRPKK